MVVYPDMKMKLSKQSKTNIKQNIDSSDTFRKDWLNNKSKVVKSIYVCQALG